MSAEEAEEAPTSPATYRSSDPAATLVQTTAAAGTRHSIRVGPLRIGRTVRVPKRQRLVIRSPKASRLVASMVRMVPPVAMAICGERAWTIGNG